VTARERARAAYYASDGTLRVPCSRCIRVHGFVGYSRTEAARRVQRGEACLSAIR
jgi:hypothetical protein